MIDISKLEWAVCLTCGHKHDVTGRQKLVAIKHGFFPVWCMGPKHKDFSDNIHYRLYIKETGEIIQRNYPNFIINKTTVGTHILPLEEEQREPKRKT